MKKIVLVFVVSLLFIPLLGNAGSERKNSRDIYLDPGEKVEGDFVNAGDTLDLAGDVFGDILVAGGDVDISGNVQGDILSAGGNVNVSGDVEQDLRLVGGNITVSGRVERNATIAGRTVRFTEDSRVAGNLYIVGGNVTMRGPVEGNMTIVGGKVVLSGNVGGNLKIYSDNINLRQGTKIDGDFVYTSEEEATIAEGVIIAGEITREIKRSPVKDFAGRNRLFGSVLLAFVVWKILASLAVALVAWKLFAGRIRESLAKSTTDFWARMGRGIIGIIVTPVAAVILLFTLIGIPLSIVALVLYGVAVYLAGILGIALFGKWLSSLLKYKESEARFPWVSFFLGSVVLAVITLVPLAGALVQFAVWVWGFGSLMFIFKKRS